MNLPYILHGGLRKYILRHVYRYTLRNEFLGHRAVEPITYQYYKWWVKIHPNFASLDLDDRSLEFVDPFGDLGDYVREMFESERPVIEDFVDELRETDVVFDVGADLGLYTCISATRGATTVAFEPLPDRRGKLRANLDQNGCKDLVQVLPYALLNHEISEWLAREFPAVQAAVGDELVERGSIPQPNVLKIDVEGGELPAVRGMRRVLADSACRVVYCELHPAVDGREDVGLSPDELDDTKEILRNCGFDVLDLHSRPDHGDQPFIKATK